MEDITKKVRKLLDQAESTSFPEEAKAFFEKAQQLITLHGIDQAALAAAGTVQSGEIVRKEFHFEAPYAPAKLLIGWVVAKAMGLDGVSRGKGQLSLFGTDANMRSYEMMLASVMIHATTAVVNAEVPPWEDKRSFRSSFMKGYANSIGVVLQEGKRKATEEAKATMTATETKGAELVLLDEKKRVTDAVKGAFPKTSKRSASHSRSSSGYYGGSAAAKTFSGHRTNLGGSAKALNS